MRRQRRYRESKEGGGRWGQDGEVWVTKGVSQKTRRPVIKSK